MNDIEKSNNQSGNDHDYKMITDLLNKYDHERNKERRKKKDWVTKMATVLSFCSWGIIAAVWVLLETAAPERELKFITSFFDVQFGTEPQIRTWWDYTFVYAAFVLLLVSLAACVAAFIFNKMRMKRKTDKYKKSIFIIGGITIIALIVFFFRFGHVIFQIT